MEKKHIPAKTKAGMVFAVVVAAAAFYLFLVLWRRGDRLPAICTMLLYSAATQLWFAWKRTRRTVRG